MMRGFRKFLVRFLTTTLCTLISFIIISLTFKAVIIDGILSEVMKTIPINMINLGGDDSSGNLFSNSEVVNEILNNEQSKELINDFFDTMMNELGSDNPDLNSIDEYDFEGQMEQYMKDNKEQLSENTGQEITDEMIEQSFSQSGDGGFNQIMKELISNTNNNLSNNEKTALNSVGFLTNEKVQLYISIALVVIVLLIVVLIWSPYKWLWNIAWAMVIGAAFPIGIGFLIDYLANSKFGFKVDVSPIQHLAFPILIIGFIIGAIYVIIDIVYKKKVKSDDVFSGFTDKTAK